jgi:carbamoyltransferase
MLFTDRVRPDKEGLIPAVRHVDGSARVQTVDEASNPGLHAVLKAFAARTGVPVLANTSFNIRGEPIVCTPRDALAAFATSPLDALAIGPFLLEKRTGGAMA